MAADLKQSFETFFKLVDSEHTTKRTEEIERILKDVQNACYVVKNLINIGVKKHIAIIEEVIKNADESQWNSASKKVKEAKDMYTSYILPYLKEEDRKQGVKQEDQIPITENRHTGQGDGPSEDTGTLDLTRSGVKKRFQSIYEKEWKEAFNERSNTMKEEAVCEDLYEICTTLYKHNKDLVSDTIREMEKTCRKIAGDDQNSPGDIASLDETSKNLMLLFMVQNSDAMTKRIREKTDDFLQKYKNLSATVAFAREFAVLTWWMHVREPPMSISFVRKGEACEPETYNYYKQPGKVVHYRVFPALLSNSNGEILVKGVMECC